MANFIEPNEIMFTAFEPKTQFRYIMYIDGIPAWVINKAKRPTVKSEIIELNHINVIRKVKSKTSWEDIEITLFDPIVPSAAQASMEWFRLSHEAVTGRDGYSDFYKKDVTINVLGPPGDKVEEWILKGAWPSNVNYGDLDWSSTDVANISITLTYDFAILNF